MHALGALVGADALNSPNRVHVTGGMPSSNAPGKPPWDSMAMSISASSLLTSAVGAAALRSRICWTRDWIATRSASGARGMGRAGLRQRTAHEKGDGAIVGSLDPLNGAVLNVHVRTEFAGPPAG